MKEYTIYIEIPATDGGDTICHSFNVEGDSKEKVLSKFLTESFKVYGPGPTAFEVIAFHNNNYYTAIPLDKILQIDVKEKAKKEE